MLTLFIVSVGSLQARAQAPDYLMPFVAPQVQNPDAMLFDLIFAQGVFRVPLTQLQGMLDTIEPSRFQAQPVPDNSSAVILINATLQRLRLSDAGLGVPTSEILVVAQVFDNIANREVFATVARYANDAESVNQFVGAPVATEANTKMKFHQKRGEISFRTKVRGIDGFKINFLWTAPDEVGSLNVFDPVTIPVLNISDGPGGEHPSAIIAQQFYGLPAELQIRDQKLVLPFGELELIEILSASLRRNRVLAAKAQ